jgi:hypothetical protein
MGPYRSDSSCPRPDEGRDDHAGSAMAQFLRTSTIPDGHIGLKSLYVFDLSVYDRDVPIIRSFWFSLRSFR